MGAWGVEVSRDNTRYEINVLLLHSYELTFITLTGTLGVLRIVIYYFQQDDDDDDDTEVVDNAPILGKRQTYNAPVALLNDIPQVTLD